ncbi:MAG: carboxypeptidase-like regulatory domain-containing protein [Acidobacteriia bacterium]|nr:carboxypeptidase-like regulatory domain-containing protein [Terriglobia bacterium]
MRRPASSRQTAGRGLAALLFGIFLSGIAVPAGAQVIQATGGTSNLLNATGGSLEFRGANFTDRFDLGYNGKLRSGFSMLRGFKGGIIDLGDQTIAFDLPTDIFDQSHYFLGRGAGFSRGNNDRKLYFFAGETANGFFAPFLNVATIDTPTVALFYEIKLSARWKLFSRNAFSTRQTSIQSLQWSAKNDTHMAFSAGVGNNQPYGSFSFDHVGKRLVADASYAAAGNNFQRVLVQTPQVSEPDRENIRLEFRPWENLRLIASRNNYAAMDPTGNTQRSAVNSWGAWANLAGFQTYGSLNQSTTSFGRADATLLGVHRDITSRLAAGVDYMASSFRNQPASKSLVGTVREILSPRIGLTQLITHTAGQTSVSYGGTFVSNRVTVSAEYETLFFPFSAPGTPQFRQVMVLGLHFQLPYGIQANYGTDVSTNGQVHYSAYGTSIGYRTIKGGSGGPQLAGAFYSNVARGRVMDPSGQPVAGAAILVGKTLAFSDSSGKFLVRMKSPGEQPLQVSLDDFTAPGAFAVVSAPPKVRVAREDSAQEYEVIVKRVPPESAGKPKADPNSDH